MFCLGVEFMASYKLGLCSQVGLTSVCMGTGRRVYGWLNSRASGITGVVSLWAAVNGITRVFFVCVLIVCGLGRGAFGVYVECLREALSV